MMKKLMHSKKYFFLLIAITTLMVCSITILLNRNNHKLEKVLLHASWTYRYADVEDLSTNSDCIAIIEVKDSVTTDNNKSVPETLYTVEVKRPIYNCEEDDKLTVYMTGGIKESQLFEIGDDPLMKKGDQYLIFAKKNIDGSITALGGSQGRMQYRNGKISSLNIVNNQVKTNSGSTIKLDNVLEDTLVNEILKYKSQE